MELPEIDYSNPIWTEAKKRAINIMIRQARDGEPKITYTQLAKKLAIKIDGNVLKRNDPFFWALLCDISREEGQAGRGMLSVVVVRAVRGWPGRRFFKLGRDLGHKIKDEEQFWRMQFDYVCGYWKSH
jgi:hypothetical protein